MDDGDDRLSGKERTKFLERVAKNPIPTLRSNIAKGKTCLDVIVFLNQVRTELGTLLEKEQSRTISAPDPAFNQFYKHGNATLEHYTGLFTMLKRAGFGRNDIKAALMDRLPIGKRTEDPVKTRLDTSDRPDQVRVYLSLTQSALDKVFAAGSP